MRPGLKLLTAACLAVLAVAAFLATPHEALRVDSVPTSKGNPPAPAAVGSPSAQAPAAVDSVDAALGRLALGAMVFKGPDRMKLGAGAQMQARVGLKEQMGQIRRQMERIQGRTIEEELKISSTMRATLTGTAGLDIKDTGPVEQFVGQTTDNVWTWEVTAKAVGAQTLTLTFSAVIKVDGKEGQKVTQVLTHDLVVDVAWPETTGEWLEWFKKWFEYGGWLWAALLAPVGAFLAARRPSRKAAPPPAPDDPNG